MTETIEIDNQASVLKAAQRSAAFAVLTLAGIAGDIWCGFTHVCREGHLGHPESQPVLWVAYDLIWIACLVAATLCLVRSDVRGGLVAIVLFLFLTFSRFLMGSGGGMFFMFLEIPALIFLGIQALWVIARVLRESRGRSKNKQ